VLAFHHARDKRDVCVRVGGKWALSAEDRRAAAADATRERAEHAAEGAAAGQPFVGGAGADELEELGVAARLKRRRRGEPESPAVTPTAETQSDDGHADVEHDDEMQVDADVELPAAAAAATGDNQPDEDADKDAVEMEVAVEGDDEDAVGEPMDEDEPAVAEPPPLRSAVVPPTPASASPAELVVEKKPPTHPSMGVVPRNDDLPTPPPDVVLHPSELAPGQTQTAAQAAAEAAQLKAEQLARQHGQLRSALATLAPTALTLDFAPFFDEPSSPLAGDSGPSSSMAAGGLKGGSGGGDDDDLLTPPELSALALQELFGDITPYVPPTPLSPSHHAQGKIDRRIDDATASGGKLAHTSRLMDIRPVLVSTLNPGRKRKGERWDDLSGLWGGTEDLRDLAEMKGEVYSSGIRAFSRSPYLRRLVAF